MARIRNLLIVILIPFVTSVTILGQDEGEIPPLPSTDVAILVVDVFEDRFQTGYESSSLRPTREEFAEGENNCFMPIDGQDSYTWGGGGNGVSPALGGSKPHGRLVYEHLQQLIRAANGQLTSRIPGSASLSSLHWIRDVNNYTFPGVSDNRIVLVSVDADGYTTQSMTERIVMALQELNALGISRFVINMSFAVVPCEDLLELDEETYLAVLEAIIDGSGGFPPELREGFEQFRNLLDSLQGTLELLNLLTGTANYTDQSRWAELLREVYYVTVMQPAFHDLMADLYNNGDDVATIVPPGDSSDCQAFRISNDPLNTFQDPLFRLLVQLDNRCGLNTDPIPDVPENIVVVPIASAGNMGFPFPFAPAIWPDVLSVSAQYEDLMEPEICPQPRDTEIGRVLTSILESDGVERIQAAIEENEITVDVRSVIDAYLNANEILPPSNSAEVQMNGIYPTFARDRSPAGCYWGTSFAAPRLSLEMAIFLLHKTAPPDCSGLTNSALALAYNAWDDKPRQVASTDYCPDFNDVMTQFFSPLGVSSVNDLDLGP